MIVDGELKQTSWNMRAGLIDEVTRRSGESEISKAEVKIHSRDYWVTVAEMLRQNWALIDQGSQGETVVYFVHDRSGVFDRIDFDSAVAAESSLRRNGCRRYNDEPQLQEFLSLPKPPFFEDVHPNGPIYSSGRFWS